MFNETALKIQYKSKSATSDISQQRTVYPVGLVIRSHIHYLVVQFQGNEQAYYLLSMQRILAADCTNDSFDYPQNFELNRYVQQGKTGLAYTDKTVEIKLKFYDFARNIIAESPISDTMRLLESGD